VTFARLSAADWIAMVAALALLFAMAADQYSTHEGDEARRIERATEPEGGEGGQISRGVDERARVVAEGAEKNAWQLNAPIDRMILGSLLLTILFALCAGFMRAAGRRFKTSFTPSAIAALLALLSGMLIAYRLIAQPGVDEAAAVKAGAPITLILLGVLAVSCTRAVRAEEAGTAWHEPKSPDTSIESAP
jgi:hypothetical protein